MGDLVTGDLHAALAPLLADVGLYLTEQTTTYKPDAGITRWEATRDSDCKVIIEHWAYRADPDARWFVQVRTPGTMLDLTQGVTVDRAVDACVLAGILPAEKGPAYRAGAAAAADRIQAHAEQAGWFDDRGVWAAAVEKAREVAA